MRFDQEGCDCFGLALSIREPKSWADGYVEAISAAPGRRVLQDQTPPSTRPMYVRALCGMVVAIGSNQLTER